MKKTLKVIVILIAVGFIVAEFFRPDRTNPPEVQTETLEASTQVPADVALILSRSCTDCHSNRTRYPWYSNVSPFSWFLDNHIQVGRNQFNMSIWNTYDNKKKIRKLDEICEQVQDGEMPLPSYLWIHWDAKLQPGDAEKLCSWTQAETDRLQATQP